MSRHFEDKGMTDAAANRNPGPCRVCGNDVGNRCFDAREMMYGTRETFTYGECADCGCLWILNVPNDLGKYYGAGYYSFGEATWRRVIRRNPLIYKLAYVAKKFGTPPRLPQWWPQAHSDRGSRTLDVGCGQGTLLMHLRSLGFHHLTGIDPYIDRDSYFRHGPNILKKRLSQVDGQFDVIILDHSLEHMDEPQEVFSHLKRLLGPNGSVIVRTPVASSLAWREYRENWVQLDPPRHLFVHTPASIGILAQAVDLAVDSVTFDSTAFQFWGSEQYRQGISLFDQLSYRRSAARSIFSRYQISDFDRIARDLNRRGEGDQACFHFKHDG